ncbi:DUF2264 domain-containing protein [Gracilibacillus oryzae]|uniref:DUF2264 domain-containing protein n=1 Tax=Gracilibacillus oryzae TaxID=1672701 RepID=A0A7C8KSH1_9BACI|nr:DUF2264 domain-containing protein [Gracilibacillus oryzae]KAB8138810.1 DUF2264 domain-containing protein [Gracilibacillus oryzae]
MRSEDRKYWLNLMLKITGPVIQSLEMEQLKIKMPVEQQTNSLREEYTYLEAFSRSLNGIAPWLEQKAVNSDEELLRQKFAEKARKCIDNATNSASKDYMNFTEGGQPIVDTAFFAQAILRAPVELWDKLQPDVKENVVSALKNTRNRKPIFSNWLLFSAIIEAALYKMGEADWDQMRVDFAIKQFEQWYVGDGMYSDGASFHFDYYNSYVIQPMLLDLIDTVGHVHEDWITLKKVFTKRAEQYANILERMISPEGTFPPVGRSLAYRFGAFHHLANQALRKELPPELKPSQVRAGLTQVIRKTCEEDQIFDQDDWLTIGFSGSQKGIGEFYISTGSLYLCTFVFLPLGLTENEQFWSDSPAAWTGKKAWESEDFAIYHSLD